jgi:hypothetical protein
MFRKCDAEMNAAISKKRLIVPNSLKWEWVELDLKRCNSIYSLAEFCLTSGNLGCPIFGISFA